MAAAKDNALTSFRSLCDALATARKLPKTNRDAVCSAMEDAAFALVKPFAGAEDGNQWLRHAARTGSARLITAFPSAPANSINEAYFGPEWRELIETAPAAFFEEMARSGLEMRTMARSLARRAIAKADTPLQELLLRRADTIFQGFDFLNRQKPADITRNAAFLAAYIPALVDHHPADASNALRIACTTLNGRDFSILHCAGAELMPADLRIIPDGVEQIIATQSNHAKMAQRAARADFEQFLANTASLEQAATLF